MPEGDTIFRAATVLRKALLGARVTKLTSEALSGPAPLGERIEAVEARGKNLVLRFEGGRALRTHMMMSGSWHIYREGEKWQRPAWQARLVLHADNGFVAVCFNAPVIEWLRAGEEPLARLGPDATTDAFDAEAAFARLSARADTSIGEALMDQSALAGVGNVIKSEALFRCRANPFAQVGQLPEELLRKLIDDSHALLVRNRAGGPRTTRESLSGSRLWVYGRSGKPCLVCGHAIRMRRQGAAGRSTYFCAVCQK
ncbi:MAG TPA: DNA-formamidopyrimidine glycosylase family protein [Myxococcales bacterium]|jgi:endonuclease-8|nr:DNA-formamidopyrimidine glycosylase family protein [Myxococcales bacterium]